MADEIPMWAKERAVADVRAVVAEAGCADHWDVDDVRPSGSPALVALARYIAEHEDEPIDPRPVAAMLAARRRCGLIGMDVAETLADVYAEELAKLGLKIVEAN